MPAEPDRLRYVPGRSRNRAHLIPHWYDGQPVREARCGLLGSPADWREVASAHRPLCRSCTRNYEINEGKPYGQEESDERAVQQAVG
jgi:hypothetical protein